MKICTRFLQRVFFWPYVLRGRKSDRNYCGSVFVPVRDGSVDGFHSLLLTLSPLTQFDMKLTPDLIARAPTYLNALQDRELDLRSILFLSLSRPHAFWGRECYDVFHVLFDAGESKFCMTTEARNATGTHTSFKELGFVAHCTDTCVGSSSPSWFRSDALFQLRDLDIVFSFISFKLPTFSLTWSAHCDLYHAVSVLLLN